MPLHDVKKDLAEKGLLSGQKQHTYRHTVSGMEPHLMKVHNVLDHGFVRVVDYMGGDPSIVQAARVSYASGTKSVSEDEALIRYLMRKRHTTPFEMCEIKLHVKLPIFVARQWIRHRTASVNEMSARYSILDKEFYVPTREDLGLQSRSNKQGREDTLTAEGASRVFSMLRRDADDCYDDYEEMLRLGLARELARMNLPTSIYTQWYWKVNLHNLFNFLALRADAHAQREIQVYANVICNIVQDWCPIAYDAFLNYRMDAVTLSSQALKCVFRAMLGQIVTKEDSGMSEREWKEFFEIFGECLPGEEYRAKMDQLDPDQRRKMLLGDFEGVEGKQDG